jgi:DNA polymerase-1
MSNATPGDRPNLYLLDGYALIYRAFFAMISRPLTTSSGENTSAPYGIARFLLRLIEDHQPDYLGVVFDAGDSFRTELFPEYKATREKMPEELHASLPRCREIFEAFRIPVIEAEGWEADDVIGTLAGQASTAGFHTVIVSGDKDFHQLIDEDTSLLNPGRGGPAGVEQEWVSLDNAGERFGIPPERVTDYLALLGDSSDNVPGVPGIGKKTAPGLIHEFGDLEQILAHAEEVTGTRERNDNHPTASSSRSVSTPRSSWTRAGWSARNPTGNVCRPSSWSSSSTTSCARSSPLPLPHRSPGRTTSWSRHPTGHGRWRKSYAMPSDWL